VSFIHGQLLRSIRCHTNCLRPCRRLTSSRLKTVTHSRDIHGDCRYLECPINLHLRYRSASEIYHWKTDAFLCCCDQLPVLFNAKNDNKITWYHICVKRMPEVKAGFRRQFPDCVIRFRERLQIIGFCHLPRDRLSTYGCSLRRLATYNHRQPSLPQLTRFQLHTACNGKSLPKRTFPLGLSKTVLILFTDRMICKQIIKIER